uniref:Arsenical pump-driving ATPase TEMP n=1 Tax=Klebsiella pneumoniae TaxID=573 RepID=A0A8B0SSI9_KLEPN|nr:Arsenical pump-driving ATPase TEMP [Klebsiella pneumoniae]
MLEKIREKGLDEEGLAVLEEDLRSPCTEEIAVFQAFSRIIKEANDHFVIIDTAPTGHTLLLLDATGAYHREMVRQMGAGSRSRDNANDAAAGSGEDQSHYRDACRNHAGTGSGRAAAGLTPGRD